MLLSEFGRPLPEGSASFREVMERDGEPAAAARGRVDWLLEHARVRPGFHELAREHRRRDRQTARRPAATELSAT